MRLESDKSSFLRTQGGLSTRAPAPVLLRRGEAAKVFLEHIVTWWSRFYPAEVYSYMQEVQYLRENLNDGTGMSIDKNYAQIGAIPVRPFCLAERFVPGFWESGGSKLWFQLFPKFASRSKKLGHFKGLALKT